MEDQTEVARRFGALVTEYALRAGYDVRPGGGGRAALARELGMSQSAVGRFLDGKSLPHPQKFPQIAQTLGIDVRNLLVEAGVISSEAWPEGASPDVRSVTSRSQPLTPEAAMDAWGITDPMIRSMLLSQINTARLLQAGQVEESGNSRDGGAAARG
ncbi:helix-turn-helix domain-containing protein [Streptomyces misionensis]|uniref:helix-turn-helix domain-containing protein n=1 Tax=Streptomyces misionensis TaxID=67331 RepID=UPI0033A9B560